MSAGLSAMMSAYPSCLSSSQPFGMLSMMMSAVDTRRRNVSAPPVGIEVQRYAVLVGVQGKEDAALFRVRFVAGEWAHTARDVALRRLHLDDLSAEACENLAAVGRRYALAKFYDPYAGQQALLPCSSRLGFPFRLPVHDAD